MCFVGSIDPGAARALLALARRIDVRFWAKVQKTPRCWPWVGGKKGGGYGIFRVDRKPVGAHRISWQLHNGPIPEGMAVLHKCDNPPCVRPGHLYLGTEADNGRDRRVRGRTHSGLSIAQVRQIRRRFADYMRRMRSDARPIKKGPTTIEVGREFGVSASTISRVVNGKTHRDRKA